MQSPKLLTAKLAIFLPVILGLVAIVALVWWALPQVAPSLQSRRPGLDQAPGAEQNTGNPVLAGKLTRLEGQPADLPGSWPAFRGADRDGISKEQANLAKAWGPDGPSQLWSIDVGEGYAGPVVRNGRVYLMDYDIPKRQDVMRCISLADGKDIWRFAYPVKIRRYHGYSRTVPALTDKYVIGIGPKCHVVCLDALSGELRWGIDMVGEYGASVPEWYTGQCPLVDEGKLILAPGGNDALLMAIDVETGKPLWRTPNPDKIRMTHSSVVPMQFAGQRMYLYCASAGVVAVSARDGTLLWQTPDWKISFANVPSPIPFEDGRVFLSGGYGAGSLMIQFLESNGKFSVTNLFRLDPNVFGATQHTPVRIGNYLYGVQGREVKSECQLVCLDLTGKIKWTSTPVNKFGLGPFFVANGMIYALSEKGKLSLVEAVPDKFNLLAQAQVLDGHEAWGPMALAGTRLLVRDLTKLVCLDVGTK